MPVQAWEDLDEFLEIDEFATECIITLPDQSTLTVTGIFDEGYLNAEIGEVALDVSQPRLLCKSADVPGVVKYSTATIAGVAYDVTNDPEHDGTGLATIPMARK